LDNVLDNMDTQAQIAEEGAIEPLVVTVLSQYCLSIQLVLVLLGGMCGFVITVGTWHQSGQLVELPAAVTLVKLNAAVTRIRGGSDADLEGGRRPGKRAAPLLNPPAQITRKQKALAPTAFSSSAAASSTSAALAPTAFSSTRASTFSAAIAATLASTAGPWDTRQHVCLEAVADLLQQAHDLMVSIGLHAGAAGAGTAAAAAAVKAAGFAAAGATYAAKYGGLEPQLELELELELASSPRAHRHRDAGTPLAAAAAAACSGLRRSPRSMTSSSSTAICTWR
jgi:hypothetical protein